MKKLLKILICTLVLCLAATGAFAAFSDMPDGEKGDVIQRAVQNGLLNGFEDGTVRPDAYITRAEMAAIMVRALGADTGADLSSFGDIDKSDWYYDYMSKAVAMGAFKGDGKYLAPYNNISRQEACLVLSRVFDMPEANMNILSEYTDDSQISIWARNELSRVVDGGYIERGGMLRPLVPMTRVEFAQIIDKIVPQYITAAGEYTEKDITAKNVMIKVSGVKLQGLKEMKNVFIADSVKGDTEIADSEIDRVIIRGGKCIFKSGVYKSARAIGDNSFADLTGFGEGSFGEVYGKPGKGTVIIPISEVEVK